MWLEVPRLLYPAAHPYAHTVIGSHEDLEAASLQDVKDFFASWYVPNNASLVIAGDFVVEEAKALVAKYFSPLASKPVPERKAPAQVERPQLPSIEVQDEVEYPQVTIFWHSPGAYQPGDAELQLLASLLGDGESSRLYQRLVVGGLAQDVLVYQSPTLYGSVFFIQATAATPNGLPKIEAAIADELERIRTEAASVLEMERLKNQFEYSFLVELESLQNRAVKLNEYYAYTGSPDYLAKDLARYRNVTAETLMQTAAQWLASDKQAKITVLPKQEGGAE
jgi:zinc protease